MSLTEILATQALWTWNIMADSTNIGEMIREDAITSVNLTTINRAVSAQGIELGTTSCQGSTLEKELGADWVWNYKGRTLLVQAKRLDGIKAVGNWSYMIDVPQLGVLLNSADSPQFQGTTAIAYYCFYNSFIDPATDESKATAACIMLAAETVLNILTQNNQQNQRTALIYPAQVANAGGVPWWRVFEDIDAQVANQQQNQQPVLMFS